MSLDELMEILGAGLTAVGSGHRHHPEDLIPCAPSVDEPPRCSGSGDPRSAYDFTFG
jgi:hypothetical protein